MRVPGLWPPPSLARHCLWAGTSTLAPTPPHAPAGTAAYSKSPSWYLPKAWRITVLTAMSGFTTQNCRVACGGEAQGQDGDRPRNNTSSGRQTAGCQAWGSPGSSPEGTAVWRRQSEGDDTRVTQLGEKTDVEEGGRWTEECRRGDRRCPWRGAAGMGDKGTGRGDNSFRGPEAEWTGHGFVLDGQQQ